MAAKGIKDKSIRSKNHPSVVCDEVSVNWRDSIIHRQSANTTYIMRVEFNTILTGVLW